MGKSKIAWTDRTWNPTTGCSKVSIGCRHCYAERMWPRLNGPGRPYEGRSFTDVACHEDRHIHAMMQLAAWLIPKKREARKMDWPGKERYETRMGIWHKKCPCGTGFLAGSCCRKCEGTGRIRT